MDLSEARKIVTEICSNPNQECHDCPFAIKHGHMNVCGFKPCVCECEMLDDDKIITICEKWKKEHTPTYPTFAEWVEENFPEGNHNVCPAVFMSKEDVIKQRKTENCYAIKCGLCRNRVKIPESIAEKLGVKPYIPAERNKQNEKTACSC